MVQAELKNLSLVRFCDQEVYSGKLWPRVGVRALRKAKEFEDGAYLTVVLQERVCYDIIEGLRRTTK